MKKRITKKQWNTIDDSMQFEFYISARKEERLISKEVLDTPPTREDMLNFLGDTYSLGSISLDDKKSLNFLWRDVKSKMFSTISKPVNLLLTFADSGGIRDNEMDALLFAIEVIEEKYGIKINEEQLKVVFDKYIINIEKNSIEER